MQLLLRFAWSSLVLGILGFATGIVLARIFLCQAHGPLAFFAACLLCVLSFLLFAASAIRRRSLGAGLGALLVALLVFLMWVVGTGITLPGCSGV